MTSKIKLIEGLLSIETVGMYENLCYRPSEIRGIGRKRNGSLFLMVKGLQDPVHVGTKESEQALMQVMRDSGLPVMNGEYVGEVPQKVYDKLLSDYEQLKRGAPKVAELQEQVKTLTENSDSIRENLVTMSTTYDRLKAEYDELKNQHAVVQGELYKANKQLGIESAAGVEGVVSESSITGTDSADKVKKKKSDAGTAVTGEG